jgi:LemA protein
MSKKALVVLAIVAIAVLVPIGCGASTYNQLVSLDQQVQAQWAQVENVYQRRLDLVPNLVETVKGAAAFEKDTFTAVTEARSRAAQAAQPAAPGGRVPDDPAALQKFQQAQEQLSGALGRLMVVVERYPDLKATQNFATLQAQLEGTENRIAVARMDFINGVREYNTELKTFPGVIWHGILYADREPMQQLQVEPAKLDVPKVDFGASGN